MLYEERVPNFSVVIVNYNSGEWLVRCASAALKQTSQVIIVDNASNDNSLALIESEFPDHGPITIIRSSKNEGFAKACNKGAKLAKTDYLLFLNPDCELKEGAIQVLIDALEQNATAGMVGGVLTNEAGIEQRGSRRQIPTLRQAFLNLLGLSRFFGDFNHHQQPLPANPIEVEAISGAMMFLRRDTFMQMNGFDEQYFLHCEDLDLCMRLRLMGKNILFVPNARAVHGRGVCSRSRPFFVLWNKHKGMAYFYKKFYKSKHSSLLMWIVISGIWVRFGINALLQQIHKIFRVVHVS